MRKNPFIYIILLLFVSSVLIRVPNIDRPLSVRYEWVTAHTLVTLGIWMEEGILEHKFNPIYTFSNPNDHFIKCPISGVSDQQGNYYYVSYPPFSFILPFLVFKLSGLSMSPLNLQIFNILLHLICSIIIFLIIRRVYDDKKSNYAAVAGTSVYIFATPNLWYHTNVYFADILVQLFFLTTIYLYLICSSNNKASNTNLVLFFLSLLLAIYTEWLGFLLSAVLFIHTFFFAQNRKLALIIASSSVIGALTIFLQYSSIAGIEEYIVTLLDRYSERSGSTGPVSIFDFAAHLKLANIYMRNFFPLFILILFGLILIAIYTPKKKGIRPGRTEVYILLLSTIPVFLHHFLLFQFTIIHELSLVKSTVPLSFIVSMLTIRVLKVTETRYFRIPRYLYYFVFAAMISLSVYFYYSHIIKPKEYLSLRLGTQIKETSSTNDTIFFKTTKTIGGFLIQAPDNFVMAPQIQYYSGRCIQVVANEEEAIRHLMTYNKEHGIIYTVDNSLFKIEAVNRVSSSPSGE